MTAQFFLIIVLSLTTILLSIGLIAILLSFFELRRKFANNQKELFDMKDSLHQKPLKLIERAEERAMRIIEKANTKADDLLSNTASVKKLSVNKLESDFMSLSQEEMTEFKNLTEELRKNYQDALVTISKEHINLATSITKDIESAAANQINDFKNVMQKETFESEKIVNQRIEDEYKKVATDIQTYKAQKYAAIDKSIFKIIQTVALWAIGNELPLEKHQSLVLEALQKAKEEGITT